MKLLYTCSVLLCLISIVNASEWQPDTLYSTTHTLYVISKDSELEIKWESTEKESWLCFWVAFSTEAPLTINDDYFGDFDQIDARTPSGLWENAWTQKKEVNDTGKTPYYFNISVVDDEGTPHPLTSLGPYFIDTEPPGSPNLTAPENSETVNIILTNIGAIDAVDMCISNSGFGVGCTWQEIQGTKKLWTIKPEADVQTTIYIQFRDDVGNISTAMDATTFVILEDDISDRNVASVPVMSTFGMLVFMGILFVGALRRILIA